jgi:hypothetical protein
MKPLRKYFSLLGTILGLLLPLFLGLIAGFDKPSFSSYYFSDAKLFFIISLTIISLSFVTLSKTWFIPCISLLILTYFNCHDYSEIHQFAAHIFFASSTYLILRDKRFRWIGFLILLTTPIVFFSIYYFELISVLLISIFHLFYMRLIFNTK